MSDMIEEPIASTSKLPILATAASSRPARKRRSTIKPDDSPPPLPSNNTNTRNGKLKLKIKRNDNERIDHNTVGYDRELDSDPEEPLAFEEHFILRVPPSLAPKLQEAVNKREVLDSTWFKFKDSRRAVFHFDDKLYGAKLVDLPTLIESQKMTGTGGHSIKVADINQMLIVENEIEEENQVTRDERAFNIEDFIYPHGITPPLKHVRKRRFRKRVNKRTIEIVEDAVEKLLEADTTCIESKYELIDDEGSDDENYNSGNDDARRSQSVGVQESTKSRGEDGMDEDEDGEGEDEDDEDGEGEEDEEDEEGEGSGYDSDLAEEINRGMQAQNVSEEEGKGKGDGSDDDSDGDGLFGASSDEEEEEEEEKEDDPVILEERRRIKLLGEEVGDLERAISVKEVDMGKASNPIFKKRFEEVIKKLTLDRDAKKAQLLVATKEMERKKEAAIIEATAATVAAIAPPLVPTIVIPSAVSNPTSEVDRMEVDEN